MNEDLDTFANDLAKLGASLEFADDFFTANQDRYLSIARNTAIQTLLSNRPDDVDDSTWKAQAGDFADLITASAGSKFLEINYVSRTETSRDTSQTKGVNPENFSPVTWQDVLEWVQTPREEGGKDKTLFEESERMNNRSDEKIAHQVFRAVKQHQLGSPVGKDFSGIAGRLEEFVNNRVLKGDLNQLLLLILEAWFGTLSPIIEKDFDQWVDDEIRRL